MASDGDLTIESRFGVPGAPLLLVATSVQGVPTFAIVLIRAFEADSEWTLAVPVPPGLSGLAIELQTFKGSDPCRGGAVGSNRASMLFL